MTRGLSSLAGLLWAATWDVHAAGPPPAPSARIEHRVELAGERTDGLKLAEISGLAWDPEHEALLAVSDRGRLFRMQLTETGGTLQVRVLSARQISLQAPSTQWPNTEALAWHQAPGSTAHGLWTTTEAGAAALQIDAQGRVLSSLPWPVLARAPATSSSKHGVEALARHPLHGLLVGPQRPRAAGGSEGPRLHAVHAANGRSWYFLPAGPRSHLKAIEWLGGEHLLLLERLDLPEQGGYRVLLRWLDLDACGDTQPCEAANVVIEGGLADGPDNFEGLACTATRRCWIASDSGPRGGAPTRLVQLQIDRQPIARPLARTRERP